MKRILLTLSCSLFAASLFALSACSVLTPPPLAPTPTLVPTLAITPLPPRITSVVDRELLGASHVQASCDAPPEATFSCENETTAPRLNVQVSASTFARWSVHWQDAPPLSGDETISLRLTSSGTLKPNLYLVAGDGSRQGIPLSQFGLPPGTQTLHIPLREVHDAEGKLLDPALINGIEIVFEWADMQGTLAVESLRLESVWREPVAVSTEATTLAASLPAPAGFQITALAQDLPQMTQIGFTTAGDMLVSLQNGRVWRYRDQDSNGSYDERLLYTVASPDLVGLLYDPSDGSVWLGSHGQLMQTLDSDGNGVADTRTIRFEGIQWGRHQNNGMVWNPDPDPFTGEPGGTWIYFGFGSTEDLEVGGPLNASILRFPRNGASADDLQVVSTGNRNAYNVVWANVPVKLDEPDGPRAWQLFASENGPDFNNAPDEVNHIRWGHNYGYPNQFGPLAEGEVEGQPYSGPVTPVDAHSSADGLTYIDNPAWPVEYRTLYLSRYGEVFNPTPVGHDIERIVLQAITTPDGALTYRGEPVAFITGFDRPLPLVTTPSGNMLVGDYATGVIYRIAYVDG